MTAYYVVLCLYIELNPPMHGGVGLAADSSVCSRSPGYMEWKE